MKEASTLGKHERVSMDQVEGDMNSAVHWRLEGYEEYPNVYLTSNEHSTTHVFDYKKYKDYVLETLPVLEW